jgi:hypothetical protein
VAGAQLGVAGIEPRAVVAHLEGHAPVGGPQRHADALRAGVAQRVVQRLLGHAQQLAIALRPE